MGPLSNDDADGPEYVAGGLACVEPPAAPIVRAGFGAGGTVDFETAAFEQAFGAEDVIAVADDDAGVEVHAAEEFADGEGGVGGGFAFGFDDDGFGGDAALRKVRAAYFAFGKNGIAAGATGGEDAGGEFALPESEAVFQACAEDGRGAAAVFGGAHDDDDVGGAGFIDAGLAGDGEGGADEASGEQHQERCPSEDQDRLKSRDSQARHPSAL